jgi:hypothetical protein
MDRKLAHREGQRPANRSLSPIPDPSAAFGTVILATIPFELSARKDHLVREPRAGARRSPAQLLGLGGEHADHHEISVHGQYGRR